MIDISINLLKNFCTQYNKLQNEHGTYIARINGFDDRQLSYTDFIDNFIDKDTVADSSIDGNSNVKDKDIVTLLTEMPKPPRKLIAFHKVYYEYEKMFGFRNANEWMDMEWTGKLYMHDGDTSSFKHYCFAYDLKDLAERGLYFLSHNFNAEAPRHLITFVDFVKEFVSFTSNRSSGAVGLPNLIPYMFYFWKKDCESHYLGMNDEETYRKYADQNFQRFIYAVNQPFVRDGQQSAFTNTSIFDRPYFEALFGGSEFPDGTFMIDYEEEIIEFQKWYMKVMSDIRKKNMFTFPVSSISLLRKEGIYDLDTLDGFEDQEFAEWAIIHNMIWSDSNLFCDTSVNSLSNCCRLKSDIKELGYFNSIGGTALKVGSVKVSTINLARIALDTNSEEEYLEELAHRTLVDIRALHVVRHIIKRNVEKKLLPNFTYKMVDFEHLYNTIGFIGVYETMKKFGYTKTDEFGNVYYTEDAERFGEKIFKTMRQVADKFINDNKDLEDGNILKVDYMINTEQIPGESAAAKLMKKDKFFYPDANIYDLPLYGNQFIPLGINTTLQERVRIQAMFDKFCNGG